MNRTTARAGVVATALVVAGGLISTPTAAQTTTAAPAASAASKAKPTKYLFSASGFSSRVIGGDLPANSDRSAFAIIGCTNLAGRSATNSKADVTPTEGLRLDTASTRAWSTKRGGTVTSHGRNTIERVVLADTPAGRLLLEGVESYSRAWKGKGGYRSSTTTKVADIVLDPPVGQSQSFPVPLPGDTVTVPGVAEITLGAGTTQRRARWSYAEADAVKINLLFSDTKVFLAHSRAMISGGVDSALFHGSAYATEADVLEGVVSSDRTPNVLTPCGGTDGEVVGKKLADADIADGVLAKTPAASTRAGYTRNGRAYVDNKASLALVNLGGGLKIGGIDARVRVTEKGSGYQVRTGGTDIGRITFDGERQTIPDSGTLTIPGLAKIETNLVKRTKNGAQVTAVRVTLLDGRVAVLNLGNARASLVKSGL
jgi:hypothetical protein